MQRKVKNDIDASKQEDNGRKKLSFVILTALWVKNFKFVIVVVFSELKVVVFCELIEGKN